MFNFFFIETAFGLNSVNTCYLPGCKFVDRLSFSKVNLLGNCYSISFFFNDANVHKCLTESEIFVILSLKFSWNLTRHREISKAFYNWNQLIFLCSFNYDFIT